MQVPGCKEIIWMDGEVKAVMEKVLSNTELFGMFPDIGGIHLLVPEGT